MNPTAAGILIASVITAVLWAVLPKPPTEEPAFSRPKGVEISEHLLSDGTRCIVGKEGNNMAIACNFNRKPPEDADE